ncbi:hypothetical protein QYF61_018871 [Mycteria americana]|uniref:Uncharacterized protein n=1 Tax=Mycteria americana TaxID=33587 RepID=A0AAN7Q5M5_MYCAM|nr:hypothetical protein QYF61_018871 [Mycteria americana]
MCLQWWKKPLDGWKHILCPVPPPGTLTWALKNKSYERIESANGTHFQNNLIDTWANEHGIEWVNKLGEGYNTLLHVLVLRGKVLVVGGAAGMASVTRHQKLPPCQRETVPASSKTVPLLAKAEPISDVSSASVITHLRKGKKHCATTAKREELEYVRKTTLQTPRAVKKEREEMLQVLEQ